MENEEIIALDVQRCSPWNGRIADADVIQDLMIHDIDIVINALSSNKTKEMAAFGQVVASKDKVDFAQALIKFDNGATASVVASRVTEDKIRSIIVHCKNALVRADLLNRTLSITRNTSYAFNGQNSPLYKQENITERVFVEQTEPLKQELLHFAKCIQTQEQPITSGESSAYAVKTLDTVIDLCYK